LQRRGNRRGDRSGFQHQPVRDYMTYMTYMIYM